MQKQNTYPGDFVANPLDSMQNKLWRVCDLFLVIFKFAFILWKFLINYFDFSISESLFNDLVVVHINSFDLNGNWLEFHKESMCLLTKIALTIPQKMEKQEARRITGTAISD